jgi:tetratricopeptide (TPR) repeat protein
VSERTLFAPAFVLALAAAAACASESPRSGGAPSQSSSLLAPKAPRAAVLPTLDSRFAPSQMRTVEEPRPGAGAQLADIDVCAKCHADVAAQWRTSAHAFASFNNPVYRVAVDRFRKDRGNANSRFCAGCHDVALLVDGAMDQPIVPEDQRAHAGIGCKTCHGITGARPDGNGSYTLDLGDIPLPKDGDPESLRRHKARATPTPLKSAAMCASCHRAYLDESTGNASRLVGQDDATPWQRSLYAGSLAERIDLPEPEKDCRGCHMPREEATRGDAAAKQGKIASHRFTGGHSWLGQMRWDKDHIALVEENLRGVASIDIAAITRERAPDARVLLFKNGADVGDTPPGERVVVDVVVRNQKVGHKFPGGVVDAQDTWIELTVEDSHGKRLAEAGNVYEGGDDPTVHRLGARAIGADGKPLVVRETHEFRAVAFDQTLLPRDATVVQYAFEIPSTIDNAQLPLHIAARLRHRTRGLALQNAACKDARTPRGRAFSAATIPRRALDPCLYQPIAEIARVEVAVGRNDPPPKEKSWDRAFDYGLGLLHVVQERLDAATAPLAFALETAPDDRRRAMALAALAELASLQGRTEDALDVAGKAGVLVPGHPALARIRGEALSRSWRLAEAAPYLLEAAGGAPRDDAGWARLAIADGSIGRADDALDAAQRGLLLQPRDADLLRIQALALDSLGADRELAVRARDAHFANRTPDDAPALRATCSATVAACARERMSVHVHEMRRLYN